jgi:hypothetical protein
MFFEDHVRIVSARPGAMPILDRAAAEAVLTNLILKSIQDETESIALLRSPSVEAVASSTRGGKGFHSDLYSPSGSSLLKVILVDRSGRGLKEDRCLALIGVVELPEGGVDEERYRKDVAELAARFPDRAGR